jgi:bacillithiol biosynthesis cysteine-adding enzyme BshC
VNGPRVLTTSLGGGAVARALLDGTRATWLAPRPSDPAEWRAHVEAVRDAHGSDWLTPLAPALSSTGAAIERLRRVADEGGVVITTGQQPGLFGGPILTWNKALAALAIADAIEDVTGVPAAPLFWAATDDADVAEGSVTHVAVRGGLETLTLETSAPEGTSVGRIPLGNVGEILASLVRATGSAVYPAVLDQAREAYAGDVTVGDAYVRLMRAVLEPLGIPVLDAGTSTVRAAAHPMLVRALERAGAGDRALSERTMEIRAAGFDPQVSPVPSLTMVFEYADGVRRRVPIDAAASVARGASPGTLGPNVLLRPIVERAILPTVAYVAGPGELAYFAQATALAAALDVAPPAALPRWSGLIIEPHIDRILSRYELALEDIREPGVAERVLATRALPAEIVQALADARVGLEASLERLARAVRETAFPIAASVLGGLDATVSHRIDRFERRVLAAQKRREAQTMEDMATARAALFPLGKPQERVLNFLPLLARHGVPLLDAMLERAREHARQLMGGVTTAADAARLPH